MPTENSAAQPTSDADAHIYAELVPPTALELTVVPHSPDARLEIQQDGHAAVIEIFSASGIGKADVVIGSENYPEQITLRLHLHGLERLAFTYDQGTVEVSLPSTGDALPHESFARQGDAEQLITADSPYWMNLRLVSDHPTIPLPDGYIEVEVPAAFLSEQVREFSLDWVDFYRR